MSTLSELRGGLSVLLLDEPFQGVDIKARRDIGHQIRLFTVAKSRKVCASGMLVVPSTNEMADA